MASYTTVRALQAREALTAWRIMNELPDDRQIHWELPGGMECIERDTA